MKIDKKLFWKTVIAAILFVTLLLTFFGTINARAEFIASEMSVDSIKIGGILLSTFQNRFMINGLELIKDETGEFYLYNNVLETDVLSNEFVKINGNYSEGILNNIIFVNDSLKIINPGVYNIQWSFSFKDRTNDKTFQFAIGKNNEPINKCSRISDSESIYKFIPVSINCVLILNSSDEITGLVKGKGHSQDVIVRDFNIVIMRLY